jgi:hypothetical protein
MPNTSSNLMPNTSRQSTLTEINGQSVLFDRPGRLEVPRDLPGIRPREIRQNTLREIQPLDESIREEANSLVNQRNNIRLTLATQSLSDEETQKLKADLASTNEAIKKSSLSNPEGDQVLERLATLAEQYNVLFGRMMDQSININRLSNQRLDEMTTGQSTRSSEE